MHGVRNKNPAPIHLEAIGSPGADQPETEVVKLAGNGRDPLGDEPEVVHRTKTRTKSAGVSGGGGDRGRARIAGLYPTGEIAGFEAAIRDQIGGNAVAIRKYIDDAVLRSFRLFPLGDRDFQYRQGQ